MNEQKRQAIELLAIEHFKKLDLLQMMDIMNVPESYEDRQKAHVAKAIAKAEEIEARRLLEEAQAAENPTQAFLKQMKNMA